jgi:hypothetical protein
MENYACGVMDEGLRFSMSEVVNVGWQRQPLGLQRIGVVIAEGYVAFDSCFI